MLFKLLASLGLLQPWMLIDVFSLTSKKMDFSELEIHATVFISLLCQVVLILLGNRRKYMGRKRIKMFVWVAYNAAEWAATYSLTAISYSFACPEVDKRYTLIMAFWAPFMLVHLGGPDTITALALEDNELWLRNGLALCARLILACLIIYKSWLATPLNILSILILFMGVLKYGERIWILWSLSKDQFRKSTLHDPDPHVLGKKHNEPVSHIPLPPESNIPNAATLSTAYYFFVKFRPLFVDLNIASDDRKVSQSYFRSQTWEKAFDVIEYELGFLFDILYTKATVIHSHTGRFIRFINVLLSISVFVAFLVVGKPSNSFRHMFIANLLMIGAIVLELYAAITLLFSDWTAVSLSRLENSLVDATYKVISWPQPLFQRLHLVPANDKWCNSLSRHNFICSCLIRKPFKSNMLNKFYKLLQSRQYTSSQKDLTHLKMFIFEDLKKKSSQATDFTERKRLCSQKGEQVLTEWMQFELDYIGDTPGPSYAARIHKSMEAEFDESVLVWHIATDLCYHSDLYKNPNIVESGECKASKTLSDYLLYILLECHPMLPYCIGSKMRYRDTHREATKFFNEQRKLLEGDHQVCNMEMIVRACTSRTFDVKGREDRNDQSVFGEGCRLAGCLLMLRPYEAWEKEKWEMIRDVWVEMVCYAAIHCSFNEHAKQLRQGGEFLTHVCLLMTHLGISERFQK
ncbi:uncharacterized protein [Euphorbia lathyris]|uniref:uncharacterized protein n=1 Tax=Euphorbia lathyris TaxID=212925 RepID=UPI0033132AB7